MSQTVLNKGRLIPITGDEYNKYDENYKCGTHIKIDGQGYKIELEIDDGDVNEYSNIVENEDGSINFLTIHYNGGGHWTEFIEDFIEDKSK